eukprot:524042-Pelagomonas_calceolata.AAC.1
MPEPDAVAVPSEEEMQGLVAEQIGEMNGRAFPGFDCLAAPCIEYAAVARPRVNGRGTKCAGAIHCPAFQTVVTWLAFLNVGRRPS